MSSAETSRSDTDNWKVPTIVEIDSKREVVDLSKRQFSEILGYSHGTGYNSAVRNKTIGYEKTRKAVEYLRDAGVINYVAPEISQIVDAIHRRGIAETHFSEAIGYESANALGNAKSNGRMEVRHYRAAVEALDYYDRNGIIPLPYELDSLKL